MKHTVENLIGPAAACKLLGVNSQNLLRSINDGIVPAYSICGQVRFKPSELRHPAMSGLAEFYSKSDNHFAA